MNKLGKKCFIIMMGLPGTGKTTVLSKIDGLHIAEWDGEDSKRIIDALTSGKHDTVTVESNNVCTTARPVDTLVDVAKNYDYHVVVLKTDPSPAARRS